MDVRQILSKCDHTLLAVDATWDQIKAVCDDAVRYKTASVCLPPCFVERAKRYVGDKTAVCTVIGFPNGYSTTESKVFEARDAVEKGADEIDMVINVGALKAGDYDYVENEIKAIKQAIGDKILKVIIETCLLSRDEIIKMCELVTNAKADYIKTSTGFSTDGAKIEDVRLMREHVGKDVKVKAAGGMTGVADAEAFINAGADRLGTSRVVKAVKQAEDRQ